MTLAGTVPEIVPARPDDAPYLGGLIAAACHDLDAVRWRIGDEDLRRAVLPAMFTDLVQIAFEDGSVEVTEDFGAVAVWLVKAGERKSVPTVPSRSLAAALGAWTKTVHAFDLALGTAEPVGTCYEKLAVLAVLPGRRNQGLGTALLAHHVANLDSRLIPAYLEAGNVATREFFRRFGFTGAGLGSVEFGDGTRVHSMWREPRARTRYTGSIATAA